MYGDWESHRHLIRRVKRQPPKPEDMPDKATADLIREAIEKRPKVTAEELRFFVIELDGGPEFDVRHIRAVMHFG